MKLLDRLILKDLVPNLLIGISMFTSLYFALGPLLAASRFLSNGIPFEFIVKFVLLNTVSILGQTFPMGMLLAVLLGFGRLSGDSETVALFAGGIPFLRIAAPAAVLGLLVSGVGYVINDPVASYADNQIVNMRQQALHQQLDTDKPFDLPDMRSNDQLQATVHIEKGFDLQKKVMREVTITLYDAGGSPATVFHAQSAHPLNNDPASKEWQLDDVTVNHLGETPSSGHFSTMRSSQMQTSALRNTPNTIGTLELLHEDPNALPFRDLRRAVIQLKQNGLGSNPDVRSADVALWNKIALPLASVVFALVGAPLALRPQRNSKVTGWLLALPIILVYYVLYTVMGSVARGGGCPPSFAAFLPDIVGLFVGIGLVWKRSVA